MGAPDGDVVLQNGAAAVCGAEDDLASLVKAFDTEMSLVHKPEEDRIQAVRELFLDDARKLRLCERRYVGLSELNARLLKVKQQLESDLDAARQEVAKVDASIARLETLRTTLSAQHEAIVEKGKASLMQQQEQRDRMSGEFNAKIQEISERLTAQGTQGLELAQRNDELKAAIAKELDGLDGEEAEANKLMETTQVALTKLEQGLAGVREEVEEEKRRFDAVEAEAEQALEAQLELRDQIQSHQGRFDGVAARLEEHNGPFEKGREDMTALKKKQKELDRERKALRMRFEKSEKANREAQEKMRRTAQELETVEARKLKLEELQVLLRKDVEGLEERIVEAQQQISSGVIGPSGVANGQDVATKHDT